jgi:hypothetical protein
LATTFLREVTLKGLCAAVVVTSHDPAFLAGLLAFLSIVVVTMAHLWRLARWWQSRRPDLIDFWIEYFVDWFVAEGRARDEAEELSTLLTATMTGLVMDTICTGNVERVDRSLERFVSLLEPDRLATADAAG